MDAMKREIKSMEDIRFMVDSFYALVREDELIGPIFNDRIGDKWPEHLEKMYRFWQSLLLHEHTYQGAPFVPHASMPIFEAHFNRWVLLFEQNINTHFEGEVAADALARAANIARIFHAKREALRQ